MKKQNKKKPESIRSLRERAKKIKLLIFDVDGVLTDGGIILDGDNNEYKKFDVRDGHGIKLLQKAGIEVALITGRYSKVVEKRAKELGIKEVYQRCLEKAPVYEGLLAKLGVSAKETAYLGDDVVDIPILRRAGLPVAVADAHEEAKKYALMITKAKGGRGAARECAEFILKAKGLWDGIIDAYCKA
ncbi:MAG: HAD-IIIA family hydrolase [Nitrospiraceae bacterium]|nr:HAD-IIIA family hydrolase [Nitrospiraceae bacterium]